MQTRSLITLATISQVESFATAASQLGMTLSAVSMQMKALETELNAELFDRSFRPPKLTPLGRQVAEIAAGIADQEQMLINACLPSDELSGTFRIGFIPTASVRTMPGFLKKANVQAPHAKFELETGLSEALEGRVASGALDAAVITASAKAKSGIRYDLLGEEKLAFAVHEKHQDCSLEELADRLPFLQFNPESGIGKVIAETVSGLTGKRRQARALVLDSVEAIMECVNEGLGFTLLSRTDIQRYASAEARILETPDMKASRKLVLARREGTVPDAGPDRLLELFGV